MSKRSGTQRKRITRYSIIAIFPMLLLVFAFFTGSASAQTHFTSCVSDTGGNANVAIPNGAIMSHTLGFFSLETNDEIAVFNPDESVCAGVLVWNSTDPAVAMTVWGDDSVTSEVDGMQGGEVMVWRVWDSSENEAWDVEVVYVTDTPFFPSGEFGVNRLYQLASFAPTAVTLSGMAVSDGAPVIGVIVLVVGLFLFTVFLFFRKRNRFHV